MTTPKSKSKTKAEPAIDLTTKAMLVRFSLHGWSAHKRDSSVEDEVAKNHKAQEGMGAYQKKLLKSDALKAYWSAGCEVGAAHKRLTLPWDVGTGILPAKLYFKYREVIEPLRTKALKCADDFVTEYKKLWASGMVEAAESLGDLFNKDDYPEPQYLRQRFDIRLRFKPLENPNDFRVSLSGGATEQLRDELSANLREEFKELMREPYRRLHEVVQKVSERLGDEDAIFRDSLIDNVKALIEVLPDLNIMDDPELTKLIVATRKDLCVPDVEALRYDKDYRSKVAKSAADILKNMKGYTA